MSSSKWRGPWGHMAVTSGVTVVFEASMGHQLEYLKIVRQTTMAPYATIVRDILRSRGIIGLWDGFLPWGFLQAALKGAVLGLSYNIISTGLAPFCANRKVVDSVSGAAAGGVQGLVLSPTLLLKTRVMTDPGYQRAVASASPLTAIVESSRVGVLVVRREGVSALMKGAGTFALKRVGDWGSRYVFSNIAEDLLFSGKDRVSYSTKIIASSLGGIASTVCTLPIDVMVANIQTAKAAGKRVSFIGAFADQLRTGGPGALVGFATRGFLPRLAHVTLTTAVVRTGTEVVKDLLDPPP